MMRKSDGPFKRASRWLEAPHTTLNRQGTLNVALLSFLAGLVLGAYVLT